MDPELVALAQDFFEEGAPGRIKGMVLDFFEEGAPGRIKGMVLADSDRRGNY